MNKQKNIFLNFCFYLDIWETRDENGNFEQNFDSKIVTEEKYVEVVEEVRIEVDALMREELKNLKAVCY
jgi:hypothetical protein